MIGDMTDKIDMISGFFYVFSILNPRFTADFACLCPQFLQTKLYRYCSLMIFETVVCIRITVIFIIRFVFQEAFKLMFVFGKDSFDSFTTVETSAHFFFNISYNLLMCTLNCLPAVQLLPGIPRRC